MLDNLVRIAYAQNIPLRVAGARFQELVFGDKFFMGLIGLGAAA